MCSPGSEPQFIFDHGFLPIPGWSLSVVWLSDAGLPNKGILSLEFFSGNGANLQNCMVDRRLRGMLCSLVLAAQRDLQQEFRINKQELFSMVNAEKLDMSIKVNFNPVMKKKQTKGHISLQTLNELDTAADSEASANVGAGTGTVATDGGTLGATAGFVENRPGSAVGKADAAKAKPVAFMRPHAAANLMALSKQAPKLSMVYWDEKAGKLLLPATYKEVNAHLKTVNIEWTYGDSEGKQQDSWHM
jgi:hypothetical protein